MTAIPNNGAACYFCLEEGPDDEGKSLVRDCSCRGDSAGFAHLSCLTKYAEQKCKKVVDGKSHSFAEFTEPWQSCNNCKQSFQNQLAVDLSTAFVTFAEVTYGQPGNGKWDKLRVMYSLRFQIVALSLLPDTDTERKEELNNKLLSMVDKTKNELNMRRWVHMPKDSEEYQYYRTLCGDFEAFVYSNLGAISMRKASKFVFTNLGGNIDEGRFQNAMVHFKKARAILNLVGMEDAAKQMERKISLCTIMDPVAHNEPVPSRLRNHMLPELKNKYEHNLNTIGMNSLETIQSGLNYARALRLSYHCIEAMRIGTKIATNSRRILGPDHKITIHFS
jgi:hypothetical protein